MQVLIDTDLSPISHQFRANMNVNSSEVTTATCWTLTTRKDYTGQAKALVPGTLYLEFPDIVLAYSERCTLLLARRWSFPPRSMCYVCTVQYEAKRLHEGFEKPSLGTRCSPSPMTAAFANRQAYSIHTKMTAAKTTHRLLFYKYLISFCDLSMLQSIVLSLPP